MASRIQGVPPHWREFIIAVLIQGAMPLMPLLLEQLFAGSVKNSSIIISAAMYSISVGFCCKEKTVFVISLITIVILAFLQGVSMQSKIENAYYHYSAMIIIVIFTIILFVAKYNEHIIDGKRAWEFS